MPRTRASKTRTHLGAALYGKESSKTRSGRERGVQPKFFTVPTVHSSVSNGRRVRLGLQAVRKPLTDTPRYVFIGALVTLCPAERFTVLARHVAGCCLKCGFQGHYSSACKRGWLAQSAEEKKVARKAVEADPKAASECRPP